MDAREFLEKPYLTADYVQSLNNTEVVILDKGLSGDFEGRKYLILQVQVVENKKIKEWRLNTSSVKKLIDTYGHETTSWATKRVKLAIETMKGRDCIIGYPQKE